MVSNIIELAKLGHERAAELKASCGVVDVRSLAQLISELATQLDVQLARSNSLAAENAGLKSALNPEVIPDAAVEAFTETAIMDHDWNDTGEYSWVENDTDVIRAVLEAIKPETPATDAFLAEVRAQGVEMLASLAGNECQRYKSINDRSGARKWKSIVILCTDFAAQIRKGVQS
ncbi:hypothetical protein D6J33_14250 [Salmonella enterica subsp. enterica serovar Liverpool]|nr:hypothetical protein [Salmonella enterica subsp. enterica serovar Liverpool]